MVLNVRGVEFLTFLNCNKLRIAIHVSSLTCNFNILYLESFVILNSDTTFGNGNHSVRYFINYTGLKFGTPNVTLILRVVIQLDF